MLAKDAGELSDAATTGFAPACRDTARRATTRAMYRDTANRVRPTESTYSPTDGQPFVPTAKKEYVLALNAMARNECNERAVSPWLSAENDIPCGARGYGFRRQPAGGGWEAFLTDDPPRS